MVETSRERGKRGVARVCMGVRVYTCACVDAGEGVESGICHALLTEVLYCNVLCIPF